MRSKTITLCRGREIDIFNVPENFEELIVEDFKAFTDGTNHDYTYVDKLGFIDRCVQRINKFTGDYDAAENFFKDVIVCQWEENHNTLDNDELYCFDNMEMLYGTAREKASLNQHYGSDDHHEYDEIQKLMCRIIKTVMNFEWEGKNAE